MGREAEVARVAAAVDRVVGGSGGALLVSGEPGIGKTSLGRAGVHLAAERGCRTLEGAATPLSRRLAYAPVVQPLGGLLREVDAAERHRLTTGLPALGLLFDGLDLDDPPALRDPALERTRLFESVARLVDRASRRAPLVWLLDDLQWFDAASVELLGYLARELPGLPVLLVGTYRPGELDDAAPELVALLRLLRRTRVGEELALGGLGASAVGALLADRLGGDPPSALVGLVAARSGGTPLFAEALVDALVDAGSLVRHDATWHLVDGDAVPTPPVVADAVLRRLDRLPAAGRAVADALAIGGDDVSLEVLRRVLAEPEAALAAVVERGLVVEAAGTELRYRFHHPLVGEVAADAVAAPARRQLHAAFAAAYDHGETPDVERLAVHLHGALPEVDVDRVLDVSHAAIERALRRYAHREAATLAEATLPLAREHRPELVVDLLSSLGHARLRAADLAAARTAWEAALELLGSRGAEVAELHRVLAVALLDWGDLDAFDHHVAAGLAALPDDLPTETHVELLLIAQYGAYQRIRTGEVSATAELMTEVADRVGTVRAAAIARAGRGLDAFTRGDYDAALDLVPPAHAVLSGWDPRYEMREPGFVAIVAAARGDLPTMREALDRMFASARRIGMVVASFRMQFYAFVLAYYEGQWDRAREILDEAELTAERVAHPRIGLVAPVAGAILHAARADFDAADRSLAALDDRITAGAIPPVQGRPVLAIVTALVALERGDPSAALAQVGADSRLRHASAYVPDLMPPWGWVARGEAEALGGRVGDARTSAAELRRLGGPGTYPDAMAARIEGLAAAVADDPDAALPALAAAAAGLDALGMPFEAARVQIEHAEAAVRGGRADAVEAGTLAAAFETVRRLGAERYVGRARRVLAALGHPVPGESAVAELTPRQLEVAELVATGLSNAEVAEQLFLSTRTVDSHLDHIYTRLGISSRAALAAWVTQRRGAVP